MLRNRFDGRLLLPLMLLTLVTACSDGSDFVPEPEVPPAPLVEPAEIAGQPGPFRVGHQRREVYDERRDNRHLPYDVWYPVDEEDFATMMADVRLTDPKPARQFHHDMATAVAPDVLVRRGKDGTWLVVLNHENLPRVLVNQCVPWRFRWERSWPVPIAVLWKPQS